ncbi:MAG: hypothetical protein JRJ54_05830 [Deltaproteobacteria bacterium]|nr:hypothetical protein [Deltaproteobacteria bacterium]
MKSLLLAVQAQLRTDLTYIRDGDIYIAPHENYIPSHVRPPCIGVKDGRITRRELVSGMWEVRAQVILAVYTMLAKEEASVIGDGATGQKGILEIAEDIHASLDENRLGVSGVLSAFSPQETPSTLFGTEPPFLQQKLITYEYETEEKRP